MPTDFAASTTLTPVSDFYSGTTAGQPAGFTALTDVTGHLVPLVGKYMIVRLKTAGTGTTFTFDTVKTDSRGGATDITVTLAATDEQKVLIPNDGRFDQGGANAGKMKIVPSQVTAVTMAVDVIT